MLVSWCVGGSKGFAMVKLQYHTVAGSNIMVAKSVNASSIPWIKVKKLVYMVVLFPGQKLVIAQ